MNIVHRVIVAVVAVAMASCGNKSQQQSANQQAAADSVIEVTPRYATGFTVRDSAGIRLRKKTNEAERTKKNGEKR